MRPTLLPYNTGGLDFSVRQIMKTPVPLSTDKANPCLTQAESTQQVNKWERTELSLDAPNTPELAAEALCLLHIPEDVDRVWVKVAVVTIVLQGPTCTTTACLPCPLTFTASVPSERPPVNTASAQGWGAAVHCHSCLLVTKAACWPTTSHSNPVITPCLQGRKGREGRKKKGQHPEKEQSHLKIAEPFQGEKGSLTHTQGLPSTSQHQRLLHEAARPFLGR